MNVVLKMPETPSVVIQYAPFQSWCVVCECVRALHIKTDVKAVTDCLVVIVVSIVAHLNMAFLSKIRCPFSVKQK